MNRLEYYLEMSAARNEDKNKIYYHGTCKIKDINSIIKNGINPPDLSLRKKNKLTPRNEKVYITSDLSYALIYVIGGDMFGTDFIPLEAEDHPFGYLCVIEGNDVEDIEPDEDSVGEKLYKLLNKKETLSIKEENIINFAKDHLTPYQFRKLKNYDDYGDLASAGKKLIPIMSTDQKFYFIDNGAHIAHHGKIIPKEIWEFDLHKTKQLKKNGSNFFKLAKRIK